MIHKTSARRWAALASGALVVGGLVVAPAIAGLATASAAPVSLGYTCVVNSPLGALTQPSTVDIDITMPATVAPGEDFSAVIDATFDMGTANLSPATGLTANFDIPISVGDAVTTVNLVGSPYTAPGPLVFTAEGTKDLTAPATLGAAAVTVGTIASHLVALPFNLALDGVCTPDVGNPSVGSTTVAGDPIPDPDPVAVPVDGLVKVTGTPKVGKTLKAVPGTSDGATITYQWLSNGKAIKKATKPSLKLTDALKGKKVSVMATYGMDGFLETMQTSKAVTVKKK